jgi:hypothetical protein
MTCPLAARCHAPACAGHAWQAQRIEDVPAYLADVRACMQATGRPFGRAAARVFAEAMAQAERECMLS